MKNNLIKIAVSGSILFLLASPAFAVGRPNTGQHGNSNAQMKQNFQNQGNENLHEDSGQNGNNQNIHQQDNGQGKNPGYNRENNPGNGHQQPGQNEHANAGQIKACQAQESAVKNRTIHLLNLVTTMEGTFDSIAERVETFYTTKLVPNGKSNADYDALVNDIQTKKTAVQDAVTAAQADSNFNCTDGNAKEQLTRFRTDLQTVKSALKEYRTAIKNLIVGVHSEAGDSITPSVSPEE